MNDSQVIELARDIHHIREDQEAMRRALERMSEAVNRLAIVEERQSTTSQAIERVMAAFAKIEERVRALEIAEPMQAKTTEWVQSAMWAAGSAAVTFMAHRAGLF
jgi:hypothetical protein